MKARILGRLVFAQLAVLIASVTQGHGPHKHTHSGGDVHGDQPMVQYVANKGQWDVSVRFKAAFPNSAMFLQGDGVTWVRMQDDVSDLVHDYIQWEPEEQAAFALRGHAWKMRFVGANLSAATQGGSPRPEYHNYFIGDDPAKWASEVPVYHVAEYTELWPGIGMRWHSQSAQVKYDLMVAPGADANAVKFKYEGLNGISINTAGELVLRTSVGDLTEMRPVAWYADNKQPIACEFKLDGTVVGFRFPQGRDAARGVVIDPVLLGATFSGQVGASNYGHCATYDEQGNIYGGAQNYGMGLPVTLGAFQTSPGGGFGTDIIVNKFNPTATTLIWATYIGGGADDKPHSMIVNSNNELCIMGSTDGTGFPTTAGCYDATHNGMADIVIVHLNASATALIGSTYLGGSLQDGRQNIGGNYGDNFRGEIMLDAAQNIFIASASLSTNFPVTPGAFQATLSGMQDGVVVGVNPTCSALLVSTYLGGTSNDNALGLRFDAAGDLFVCGITASANFPTTPGSYQPVYNGGAFDGYVVKLMGNGSTLANSTFFGSAGSDRAYFIDLDSNGNAFIYGQSDGAIPVAPVGTYGNPAGPIFVAGLDPTLGSAIFTTKLGSATNDGLSPVAFLVDVCDNIYISGYNPSSGWATTPDALYATGGYSHFYLAAYSENMTGIEFATYYGGSHVDGGTSRFDKNGVIYQGVCSGGQSMPTTPGSYAPTNNVGWDLGIFKIDFQVAGVNAAGASTLNQGCAPIQIDFSNASTGDTWFWDFGDGSPIVEAYEPSHTYTEPGTYMVTLIALDSLSCNLADTMYLPITIGQQQPIDADFTWTQTIDCTLMEITTTNLSTGNPLIWYWDMGDGTQYLDTNIVHQFPGPGSYLVQLIAEDPTGCSGADTVQITIDIGPPLQVAADFVVAETPGCEQLGVQCTNQSVGVDMSYLWDMGDGTTYTTADVNHLFQGVGTYTIMLIVNDAGACNVADTVSMNVTVLPSEPINVDFTADQVFDCDNLILSTANTSTGTNAVYLWELSDGSQYSTYDLTHIFSGVGTYTVTLTMIDTLGCSPSQTVSIEVQIDPLEPVVAAFSADQVGDCTTLTLATNNQSTGDLLAYSWNMGDGTVINDTNVVHQYTLPGVYTVTLTITDLGCGQDDATSMQVILNNILPIWFVGDTIICPDDVAVLNVILPGTDLSDASFLWSTGETTPTIAVDEPGLYTVNVSDGLCQGNVQVVIPAAPRHALYDSVKVCPNEVADLRVPIDGLAFHWSTGAYTREIRAFAPGLYTYDMIDLHGCPHTDSLRVVALDSLPQIFAPNAFTPDGDAVNDVFRIAGFGEKTVKMTIFNRWGEQLWMNEGMEPYWDGRYNGRIVQDGVYVYVLKYTGACHNEEKETIGHVTVVR